ncbi:RNA polymerase sigma factor [Ruminococcus sp.]|uniref:RNA polymerase sigma factor n=1 Tax=Ruminococcus sp. TaxID=41978 RepID=UPI0025CF1BEE|nr:RNA polymerase sigma factor [Ruminococcus sp.]
MDNGASSYLRFLNGDKNGFVDIVKDYKDGLTLFINTIIRDIHISEEAANEVFLKLYLKKPKYKSQYSFKTWLYAIGRNTAINYLKKFKRTDYSNIEDCCYISDEKDIEMDYIKGEQNFLIHQALKALKAEYAQILYLIYFEELSNSEAAEIVGKSPKQISDLIYCAKKSLKAELERRGKDGQI